MIRPVLAALVVVLLFIPIPLSAQDFGGRWEMTRETPRGTMTQVLTLEQDGEEWSGTMTFMQREVALTNVQVDGDRLTFTLELPMRRPGGGGGGAIEQRFTGTLKGDEISGEMEGPRGAQPMVLKRAG